MSCSIPCPACSSTGKIYYNDNGERISEEEYRGLPTNKRGVDRCAECDGSGYMKDIYEPDYDY